MVRAILDGRKTCTRRIVKGFIPNDAVWGYTAFTPKRCISCRGTFADGYGEKFFKLPYQPGDILYVRETIWQKVRCYLDVNRETQGVFCHEYRYVATDKEPETGWNFSWVKRPSIHMPKEAARIWLKVTDVRVGGCRRLRKHRRNLKDAIVDCLQEHAPQEDNLKICGTPPSRNPTLITTVGVRIRGCGLLSLNDVRQVE